MTTVFFFFLDRLGYPHCILYTVVSTKQEDLLFIVFYCLYIKFITLLCVKMWFVSLSLQGMLKHFTVPGNQRVKYCNFIFWEICSHWFLSHKVQRFVRCQHVIGLQRQHCIKSVTKQTVFSPKFGTYFHMEQYITLTHVGKLRY